MQFEVELPKGAEAKPEWIISGELGQTYRPSKGRAQLIPWMRLGRKTGELTGVPREPGACPVIVGCCVSTDTRGRHDSDQTTTDARLIMITVTK